MRIQLRRKSVITGLAAVAAMLSVATGVLAAPASAAPARPAAPATVYAGSVPRNTTLFGNDYIYTYPALGSAGGSGTEVKLVMQPDGNLVQYAYPAGYPPQVCWSSGTFNHPGAYAVWQSNSYLLVDGPTGIPLWASHDGSPGTTLSMSSENGALFAGDARLSSACY